MIFRSEPRRDEKKLAQGETIAPLGLEGLLDLYPGLHPGLFSCRPLGTFF